MGSEKISVVIIALNEEVLLSSLLQKISGVGNIGEVREGSRQAAQLRSPMRHR
jgi:hypothetical protein